MYKSKKQNYPGLYGKFQKIDASNLHKLQQTETNKNELKHDFSTDENLESLEALIKSLKKTAKEQANVLVADTQEEPAVKVSNISDHEIDDRLLKLKQEKSLLDGFSQKRSEAEPIELDVLAQIDTDELPEEELFSSLVTDSSFIDDLEHDILKESSVEDADFSSIEHDIRSLTERISQLSDDKRLILLQGSVFQEFLKVLDL